MSLEILDNAIRRIPDFPKKGILFYDITGVLVNPPAFKFCLDKMVELYKDSKIDAVAGIEGLDNISSTSKEGKSTIRLEFSINQDIL